MPEMRTKELSTKQITRVRSVDILRGIVMVVMALDHCRDFFSVTPFRPEDVALTTPGWFATRWITHFCAPLFVFLAGTSAWFYRVNRDVSKAQMAKFLVTRGVWLIFVEIVIIGLLLHFGGYPFFFLQVIWVIGWSMIILAVLIFLPNWAIVIFGLTMIAGHNLLDGLAINSPNDAPAWWQLLHVQGFSTTPLIPIIFAYPLLPWPGVMALGYVFGLVMQDKAPVRDRICVGLGILCLALFVVLRIWNIYGEPAPWSMREGQPAYSIMSFLNTTKYPPSFLFLLMTIGPAFLLIPFLERMQGPATRVLEVFGRVPFFYYIAHWFVIRAASFAWLWLAYNTTDNLVFTNPSTWPPDYEASLSRTYIVWILVVVLLYPICYWYMQFKTRHRDWKILTYL